MKIVIDIPENVRTIIIDRANNGNSMPLGIQAVMVKAIVDGTPIPWGYTIGLAGGFDKTLDDIKTEIDEKLKEPEYLHEGEDWQNGLIMAEIIINKHTEDFHYDGEADIKSISTPTGITFDNYNVLNDIKTEINTTANQEMKDDMRWACGLRYSLKIIDKHIGERSDL